MSRGKRQSIIVIGFGLIILSAVILYYALSMPKISVSQVSSVHISSEDISENSFSAGNASSQKEMSQSSTENDTSIAVNYPLNLNSCTAEELMSISGIGEVKANHIIEYREYLGGYTSVEQIKNIKGIGDGVYEKVSPYLTV